MLHAEDQAKEQELITALNDLSALLRQYGVNHWAGQLDDCRDQLRLLTTEPGKALVAGRIRAMYGGMGGLTDLIIGADNGHNVQPDHEPTANDLIGQLVSRIWNLTDGLWK